MARLATGIAATFVDTDNMPNPPPNVSIFEALLPKRVVSAFTTSSHGSVTSQEKQKVENKLRRASTSTGGKKRIRYFDVSPNKGRNGGKALVAHKTASEAGDGKKDDRTGKGDAAKGDWQQVGGGTWKGKNDGDPAKKDDKKGDAAAVEEKDRNEPWTDEEDAKLAELKAEGKPWKAIAEEIAGRPVWQCKQRFKELPADGNKLRGGKDSKDKLAGAGVKRDEGKSDKGGKGEAAKGKTAQDGKKLTKKEKKALKAAGGDLATDPDPLVPGAWPASRPLRSTHGGTIHNEGVVRIMDEDAMFNYGELRCLVELINIDPDASWQRVAARFFNRTGRRVEAEDVRDKLEFWSAV
ncbi:hypothetical protein MBLNU230_g1217t1 [Neophaeotheca triangularis]